MPRRGIIEDRNLGSRILQLYTKEGKHETEIAEIFKAEGIQISQPTISRWLKRQRNLVSDQVGEIVQEHVKNVVPKDMEALEEMEAACLDWSREGPDEITDRLAAWPKVREQAIVWANSFMDLAASGQSKKLVEAARGMVHQVVQWVTEDFNAKAEAIKAMRMATNIIDVKLKYSGIIEGAESGNIIVHTKQPEKPEGGTPSSSDSRRLVMIKGNQDAK